MGFLDDLMDLGADLIDSASRAVGDFLDTATSNFWDYDDDDYDDYDVRRAEKEAEKAVKLKALKKERTNAQNDVNQYKTNYINAYEDISENLRNKSGSSLTQNDITTMNNDVKEAIKLRKSRETEEKTGRLKEEIKELNNAIKNLTNIQTKLEA